MSLTTVLSRMQAVMEREYGTAPETATEDKRFADIGFDSLDEVELELEFEDEFNIVFDETDEDRFSRNKTVGELARIIEQKLIV